MLYVHVPIDIHVFHINVPHPLVLSGQKLRTNIPQALAGPGRSFSESMKILKARSNGPNTGTTMAWWGMLRRHVDVNDDCKWIGHLETEIVFIQTEFSESLNWNHLMEVNDSGYKLCCLRELTYKWMVIEYVWYRDPEKDSIIVELCWINETVILRGNVSEFTTSFRSTAEFPHDLMRNHSDQQGIRYPENHKHFPCHLTWPFHALAWGHSTLQMVTEQPQNLTKGLIRTASFILSMSSLSNCFRKKEYSKSPAFDRCCKLFMVNLRYRW